MSPERILPRVDAQALCAAGPTAIDSDTLRSAAAIVTDVRERGDSALREYAARFDGLAPGAPLLLDRSVLDRARDALAREDRAVLERTAQRIATFARAQRAALAEIEVAVQGGVAGHRVVPVERAGCYAPGGRHPLPSSVLMTAVTARVAGVETVIVASPNPAPITLAAAAIADADAVLACGGAQAVAALAHGTATVGRCDVVVGPGNRFVTAAKRIVAGDVGIDMLAGPSELCVVADEHADPVWIAADLCAQAEHDVDARAVLVSIADRGLVDAVEAELHARLATLPTAAVARAALARGAATVVPDAEAARWLCDRLAPEHLQVMTRAPADFANGLRHHGALFLGAHSAEVFGDYGIGPNHVLPTGGAARQSGGLSVLDFLRVRTWLRIDTPDAVAVTDAARLAELEGLAGHAAAARCRARR
ncbi:MAG: histidinol dehydrogenase [Planctomycetota bacterium]